MTEVAIRDAAAIESIVARAASGDHAAFARLVAEHHPSMARREGTSTSFDVRPDGSQIAFATDLSLALLRPDGTQDRVLPVPGVSSVRYSPDGTWLLIDAYTAEVPDQGSILIRTDGSTSGEPVSADATLGACQWAPDGTQLLCFEAASNGWLVDLETRALTPTTLSRDETQFGIAWQRIPAR